jgi:hypothetical protein
MISFVPLLYWPIVVSKFAKIILHNLAPLLTSLISLVDPEPDNLDLVRG